MPYRLVKMYGRKSDALPVPRSHDKYKPRTANSHSFIVLYLPFLSRPLFNSRLLSPSHFIHSSFTVLYLNTNRHSSRTKLQKTYHLQSVKPGFPFILSLVSFVFSTHPKSMQTTTSSHSLAIHPNIHFVVGCGDWNEHTTHFESGRNIYDNRNRIHILLAYLYLAYDTRTLGIPSFRWIYFLSV